MQYLLRYLDFFYFAVVLIVIALVWFKRRKQLQFSGDLKSSDIIEDQFSWLYKWLDIIIALVILVVGWLSVLNETSKKEKELRQNLIIQTENIANSIHPGQVSYLTFSSEDLDSPYFKRISEQIRGYSDFSGLNNIYTVARKDDDYFFGPESIDPADGLHSPVGTKYIQPPAGLQAVFDKKKTRVDGPYDDEYGRFFSCFAPVMDKNGEAVLMVVGVDIPVQEWNSRLSGAKLLPLSVTTVLLLLLVFGYQLPLKNKPKMFGFEDVRYFRYREAVLVFLAGLVLTFFVGRIAEKEGQRYRRAVFSQNASIKGTNVARSLEMMQYYLSGMSKLFSVSEEVTSQEFSNYVRDVLDYPFISSAGWIKMTRNEDFAVEYLVPAEGSRLKLGGYNLLDDSSSKEAVMETLSTGFISATDSYTFSGQTVMDLFLLTNHSDGTKSGFVFLSFLPGKLVEYKSFNQGLGKDYFEISIQQVGSTLLSNTNKQRSFLDSLEEKEPNLSYRYLDFFFGKTFSISIGPGTVFFDVYDRSSYWSVIIIGVFLTLIITTFVLIMSNRRILLEKQIEKHASRIKFSEERFRSLFSNMMEGVAFHEMIYNDEGIAVNYRTVEVNKAYEQLLGVRRENIVGRVSGLANGEDMLHGFERYISVVEEGIPVVFEDFHPSRDKYFEISVAPWSKAGFATIYSDITKRRLVEKRLKKSEERYRLISENAGDLIWLYDPVKEFFNYVSPSVEKITGFTYTEVVGKHFKDFLTSDSYANIKYLLPLRIARFGIGDESTRVNKSRLNIKTKAGGEVPMEIVTTLLANENGKINGVLGVGRDISDRIEAEEALRKSEEKYRLLVENQNDLIVKVDKDGYFLYVSPSYCELFGKSEEELLNQKFLPLVHPEDQESTAISMKELLFPPYQVTIEQRAMTRDGWKWLSWHDSAVLDESGNVKEIIGVGRDITDRKMAENALKESREMLERQNDEYASLNEEYLTMNEELTSINEDLSLAIERAEESEKLKTAFLQNMSHEIRTPLNAIIGFSEMLGLNNLSHPDRKNFTTIIVNSSRQLLELVNDILTISAIETRQDKLDVKQVNINDLLSELYTIFRTEARERGLELVLKSPLPREQSVLLTDELKLRQVFINLIGNALKFTEEGSVELGYDLTREKYFRFFVKDTGVGISKGMQEHVFERFMQADNSIKGNYGGTGLGLAICKGHVEMMGGEIWIKSTPGVGSVFYFTLPGLGRG